MKTGFKSQCLPSYRILSDEQIQELHRASLDILETVGVRVSDGAAVAMLRAAGCRVKDQEIVLFPKWLVEECIRSTPSRITIFNRKGEEAMRLEGRNIYFGMGTDLIHSYDLRTGELRPSVLQDVVNAAIVADACPEIDFIASFALPCDVSTNTMYIECVRAMLQSSTKPIFTTAGGAEDLAVILAMAETVVGGEAALREKPMLIHYSEPTPPLTHSYGAIQKLFLCADKGVPITYVPGGTLGGTMPVTLAGGVVQANAEMLSGLVLHQLRRKGAPIIAGWAVVGMDMRTAVFSYASPEFRLTNSVFSDLYHYYGIPIWSTVGSDANVLDQQAGIEHAMSTLLSALDGANLIHDIGYLGQGLIGNPAMLVMGNEIISYVKRFMAGFEMSEEALALDVIQKVGPGGNYLAEDHTYKFWRQELWHPKLMNRDNPDVWQQKGRKTYGDLVTRQALDILETHKPEPLAGELRDELARLVQQAETDLAGKHFQA